MNIFFDPRKSAFLLLGIYSGKLVRIVRVLCRVDSIRAIGLPLNGESTEESYLLRLLRSGFHYLKKTFKNNALTKHLTFNSSILTILGKPTTRILEGGQIPIPITLTILTGFPPHIPREFRREHFSKRK